MIKLLKRNTKWVLKVILSIQLCLSPYYAYSNNNDTPSDAPKNEANSNENNAPIDLNKLPDSLEASLREAFSQFSEGTIDPFQMALDEQERDLRAEDEKSPELQVGKKIDILNAIATAMDTGAIGKYLDEYPEVRKKSANIFLFADQSVESMRSYFDPQKNRVITKVDTRIDLNDYASHPVPVFFTNIRVKHRKRSNKIIFEGVRTELMGGKEREIVVVRHHVSNMNIIDYFNDGELLVLVDKNKGLLIANMVFAEAYLGKAPIPFTTIPVPVLEHLNEISSADNNKGKVTVEFYNSKARKPDIVPEYVDNLQKTFEGRSLITHGDLMVSYIDSNNQKHLVQFLKRTELAGWMKIDYNVLDMIIKMVVPYIMDAEELKLFEKKYNELNSSDKSRYSLAALFSRGSIQKLIQAKNSIAYLRDNQLEELSSEKNTIHRQTDTLEEIQKNINLAVEDIAQQVEAQESTQQEKIDESTLQQWRSKVVKATSKALRLIQAIQTHRTIQTIQAHKSTQFVKNKASVSTQFVKDKASVSAQFVKGKTPEVISSLLKEQWFELVLTLVAVSTGGYFFLKSLLYMDGLSFYSATTLPHLLVVGVTLPVFLILAAKSAVPASQWAYKNILPKTFMRNFINKWSDKGWALKLTGFAIKFVSIGMLGSWVWVSRAMGKPQFFKAMHKGLNPFEVIPAQSDIGKVAGIEKDMKLGASGWKWNPKGEKFIQNEHLIDTAEEKQNRIRFVAWLMATLAIAKKANMDPIDSLIYGVGRFDLKELARMKKDHALQMEFLWVIKNLEKEIKKLNQMDMRTELTNLDPELLKKYYEKAQEQVEKFHADPEFKQKSRAMTYTAARLIQQTPARHFNPRSILTQNMDQVEKLSKVPSDFVADRFLTEFMMDHLVVMLLPLVTTERAAFNFEHFTADLSTYTNKFLFTGEAHLQDVWQNVLGHFIIAGGQRAMQFSDNPNVVKDISAKHAGSYKSSANTLYPIEGKRANIFHEIGTTLHYLTITGDPDKSKGYPENFSNFGEAVWTEYKTRFKTWQIGVTLMIGMRMLLSPQTFEEAGFAFLLINLLGGFVNVFWILLGRSHQSSAVKLTNNKKRIETLRDKLYRINQALYENKETLQADYKESIFEMIDLYKSEKYKKQLLSRIAQVNPTLFTYMNNQQDQSSSEFLDTQDLETIKRTSQQFLNLISESPPLPIKPPNYARRLLAFGLGGIVTTFIAVDIMVRSFDKGYLNWEAIGITAGIMFSLYTALYWGYSEKFKQWRNTKGTDLLSRKTQRSRDWSIRFYKEVLDAGQGTINFCRRAFRGSP